MKYLIAAIALSVGAFVTTGTASAQHYNHGGYHSHGNYHNHGGYSSHGSHHHHGGYNSGGYAPPSVGIYSYAAPTYGGDYSQSYDPGVYSSPSYYSPRLGFSASIFSGGYYGGGGHSHGQRRHHHHQH